MNPTYRATTLVLFLFFQTAGLGYFPLWADPATLENFDYKINLSETMPGIDNAPATLGGPVINVDVTDKLRGLTTRFPLKVYSINAYFLSDDKLNLLCRTTLRDTTHQLFSLIQLNLSNNADSRQFQGLTKYYFSPDNGSVLAVIDEGSGEDSIGLIRLDQGPAVMGWLYSEPGKVNLFQNNLPPMGGNIRLASVVGWGADALEAAFILSAEAGTPDAPALKYYLARLTLSKDKVQVAVKPVDLAEADLPEGGTIDRIDCVGEEATLYFPPKNFSSPSKMVIALPRPPEGGN